MNGLPKPVRRALTKDLQVKVFRRDGWICHWCGRPVIFAPALKCLERLVRQAGFSDPLAYYDAHWTRRNAPLLDYIGAVVDHVEAHSTGGPNDETNLVTACCKCNALKSDAKQEAFKAKVRRHIVKGKYGEPEHWDGLSALFVILLQRSQRGTATVSENDWLKALRRI